MDSLGVSTCESAEHRSSIRLVLILLGIYSFLEASYNTRIFITMLYPECGRFHTSRLTIISYTPTGSFRDAWKDQSL